MQQIIVAFFLAQLAHPRELTVESEFTDFSTGVD